MEAKDKFEYEIDYELILKYYDIEDVKERFGIWYSEAKKFIEVKGLNDSVRIDTRRLGYAVCDYFVDVIRMKEFHGITHANLNKIYAYSSYWFLRRQPLQLISPVDDTNLYINELFVVNNMIAKMRRNAEHPDIINKQSLLEMGKLFLYNFKFRIYSAQSIEVAMSSFFTGNGNRSGIK